MSKWTMADIPPQHGRTAVITGTGGLGFEDAAALAKAGARVILAGRSVRKGGAAVTAIRERVPEAEIRFEELDLARLSSIAAFGARIAEAETGIDLLVNNAGVMVPPALQDTADGFELQFGTNHLGHVALTAALLPLLRVRPGARVIALSSIAARSGAIDFDNLNAEQSYRPMTAYAQSKLACLLFAFELQRRSMAAGWGVTSIASHPGIARTDLLHNAPGKGSAMGRARSLLWFLFQPAAQGALPTLYAATSPDARPGGYYGPNRWSEGRGYPAPARIPPQALDQAVAARLWDESVRLTGARF